MLPLRVKVVLEHRLKLQEEHVFSRNESSFLLRRCPRVPPLPLSAPHLPVQTNASPGPQAAPRSVQ